MPGAAPTLLAPANGAVLDASAGLALRFNPNGPIAAARIRRRASGATAYSWWNGSAWVAGETGIALTVGAVDFPAGVWPVAGYVYSVAVDDGTGFGPYAPDAAFTVSSRPVVDVTAPVGAQTTTRPQIRWTYTDAEGDPQETVNVRVIARAVYDAAGFDPGGSTAIWETRILAADAVRDVTPPTDLPAGGTFRAYVLATQRGGLASAWNFETFTVPADVPPAPLLTVTVE